MSLLLSTQCAEPISVHELLGEDEPAEDTAAKEREQAEAEVRAKAMLQRLKAR